MPGFPCRKAACLYYLPLDSEDPVCGRLIEAAVKIVTLHVTSFWSIVVSIYNNGPI